MRFSHTADANGPEAGRAGRVEIEEHDAPWGGSILAVSGEPDVGSVSALRDALERVVAERRGPLVVDLSDVTFIDSLSIAAIVAARRRLGEERRMAVVASHPYVRLIFEAGGLDAVMPLFESLGSAADHVRG